MEKIESFKVNHLLLKEGLYVSRIDNVNGNIITTFDIRVVKPNIDGVDPNKVMDNASIHAIEHLGATFLRNHNIYKNKIIYFGPMGCRTGFYLVVSGSFSSRDIFPLINEMFQFIINYEGLIPGASPHDCGNYLDLSLDGAKKYSIQYMNNFLLHPHNEQFIYSN